MAVVAITVVAITVVGGTFLVPNHVVADDLEKLVRRLQLKELEATLVENQLTRTIDLDQQNLLRQRLARLYVEQLNGLIERPEQFSRIAGRLKELETNVEELREPKNIFARLQAQFRHGEYLLSQYRENRHQTRLLVDISRLYSQLLEEFQSLELACEKKIEALDSVDAGVGSIENRRADDEIEELSEISFRSAFYRGWSAFHAGLAKQNRELGRPYFTQALQAFCNFLDIDLGDDVENWDEGFLDLASLRNSQAFFGIALSFLAIGNNSDADYCFELLRSDEAAETVRQQLAFWQVQTLLELRLLKDGEELAKAYLENSDLLNDVQRGQIALLLVRIAYQDPKNQLTQLGFQGLKVLAQMRQFALIQKLVEQNSIVLPGATFYSQWIRGQLGYQKAEKTGGGCRVSRGSWSSSIGRCHGKRNPGGGP